MSERGRKTSERDTASAKSEKTEDVSSHRSFFSNQRDFEAPNNEGRTRASSWDDSDDNSPPILDSRSQIYSKGDKRVSQAIASEISELKKQFFEAIEREKALKEHSPLDSSRGELEILQYDRRKSPARRRRRTKSSENSSPLSEVRNQIVSESTQELNTEYEELSSKFLEYDPVFYLNNFFSELRSRRISSIDPISVIESLGREIPTYDRGTSEIFHESNDPSAKGNDEYFSKTYKKLSQILEVDESRRDLEKDSEENISDTLFDQKELKLERDNMSPLQKSRSKISQKLLESYLESREEKEKKFLSTSLEYLKNSKDLKSSFGNLSERSFSTSEKREDDSISLSAKSGKTHLPSLNWQGENTQVQLLSPSSPTGSNKNASEDVSFDIEKKEKDYDLHESLKIYFTQNSENPTPRKSTNRSEGSQTCRTTSGKSRRSWNLDSPRFRLNLEEDSVKSLKVEDVDGPDNEGAAQSEDRNSEKSNLRISDRKSEAKTTRNSRVELENLESSNSRSPKEPKGLSSSQTLRNMIRKQKSNESTVGQRYMNDENGGSESTESNFSVAKSRSCSVESYKSSEKSQKGGMLHKSEEDGGSQGFMSSRISEFLKGKNTEIKHQPLQRTPRSTVTPESSSPLNIPQTKDFQSMSNRSLKSLEFEKNTRDSNRSSTKQKSWKSFERSLNSRSRTTEAKNCTLRSFEAGLRESNRGRSADGVEIPEEFGNSESGRIRSSKELVKSHVNNNASASSTTKTSLREFDIPIQQMSCRSEISIDSDEYSGRMEETESSINLKIQLPGSRKSHLRSAGSHATESPQVSSARSTKMKSRPSSWFSSEHKSDVPPDTENVDGKSENTNRSFPSEVEDEEKECHLTVTPKTDDESDKHSNKRLPIINEVSFEDLGSRKDYSDNEEKDRHEENALFTRRSSKRGSPQSLASCRSLKKTPKSSDSSLKGKSLNETNETDSNEHRKPEEKWSQLIETFQNSNSGYKLENNFPGFQDQEDISWDLIKNSVLECKTYSEYEHEEEILIWKPKKDEELEKNESFGKVALEKNLKNITTAHEDLLSEKGVQEEERQNPQNIYYFNVRQGPFGIGGFGDVTTWNDAHFDNTDFEKPKDHGDGTPTQRNSQIFPRKPEKKEKETKTQRQLWTELRKDKRDSSPFLENVLVDVENDLTNFISNDRATVKNENWIERKEREGEIQISMVSSPFTDFTDTPEVVENKLPEVRKRNEEGDFPSKSTVQMQSNSENSSEEDYPFLCKRSPRRSKSMSAVNVRLQDVIHHKKGFRDVDDEKEITDLNIFLARDEKERTDMKSNTWLESKSGTTGRLRGGKEENFLKRGKKVKSKSKGKSATPFKESSYLSSGKSRASIPDLKLRNFNCFQNFYKRFISVFCLTSNSSPATSK